MKRLLFCVFLMASFFTMAWAMGESPQAAERNPLFVIGMEASPNNLVVDESLHAKLFTYCNKYNINLLYLDCAYSLANDQRQLGVFIAKAHQEAILVYAVGGTPGWASHHGAPLRLMDSLITFNEGHPDAQKLDGILFNIQSFPVGAGEQAPESLMKKYDILLEKIAHKLSFAAGRLPLMVLAPDAQVSELKKLESFKTVDAVLSQDHGYPIMRMVNGIVESETKVLPTVITANSQ